MLEEDLPDLLPELRPYQRRAAYWMVQREKEGVESMPRSGESRFSPLCLSVEFLGTDSKMFYNPFRYEFIIWAWLLRGKKVKCFVVYDSCILQRALSSHTYV